MDKSSSKGSMFDGLQIFGKTDAKFSMAHSFQGTPSRAPALPNLNYNFDNTSGPSSLPSRIGLVEEDEELPPTSYPLEPKSLNISTPSFPSSRSPEVNHGLPKTWGKQPASYKHVSNNNTGLLPKDELAPLQKVSFRGNQQGFPRNADQPPPLLTTSPDLEITVKSDNLSHFFERALAEIEKFDSDLKKIDSDHESVSSLILDEVEFSEVSIKSLSLLSIQRLLRYDISVKKVQHLKDEIQEAINKGSYEEAEKLQNNLEELQKDLQKSQLLIFQPPRLLDSTKNNLKSLGQSRKSYIETLKNFCVSLDELSSKFKSITKKIEVQCFSKMEKRKQDLEVAQNALDFKVKHFDIDRDYNLQREKTLANELTVLTEDHNLQMKFQDEQLLEVQSEIRVLEERLAKLRSQEKSILEEKKKLISEKVENEMVHQDKSLQLKKEKDSIHVKEVTIQKEKSDLFEKQETFSSYSSQMEKINKIQTEVNSVLTSLKTQTCESITQQEDLIVSEVQVDVSSDVSHHLKVPESLTQMIDKITVQKNVVKQYSDDLFDCQRQISKLKSTELMDRTHLNSCRSLKSDAISQKRFQDAGNLSNEEKEIASRLSKVVEEVVILEKDKILKEAQLKIKMDDLNILEEEAITEQAAFDHECYKTLVRIFNDTMHVLDDLPKDLLSINKDLLKFDACYAFSFLNMIKYRNTDFDQETDQLSPRYLEKVKVLLSQVSTETESMKVKAVKLKSEVDNAVGMGNFEAAELITKKYDLVSNFLDAI